ncbi:hypothetical protein HG535_0B00280 [Zygotorulaspora mrakii]|uniref:Major facilitator superfamily (MFS) profile domain-containing protein n=1 Tax=Zygotorulaspora mrakii TaxID=42260 RepID=A0A7H9AXH5_ZYGMR|nr:uncharacterized protein HG535_0B00280 [Zygotorulaspora mrakii]QLG70991.1 hypothetical protein HG535_0B00280 [Zygotorulaspora mrakii]
MSSRKLIHYDAETRKQRLNEPSKKTLIHILTIIASGFALISDGYQNNAMSMLNRLFPALYGKENYTSAVSTRVSNASLVGTIIGQVVIGFACDYMGRKWSILTATILLVLGSALCAASHGITVQGMFWMLTVMRGVVGVGIGAEYPSASVSANEAANEYSEKHRGGLMVLVTNLPLSLGGPFASIIFLIVYSICGPHRLEGVWRAMFALGCFWPLSVFYFRWKMATSELYKKARFTSRIPLWLIIKFNWVRLVGTCGAWFMFDFVTFPNGIFSGTIISSIIGDSTDLKKICEWNLLLGIIAIPGVFVGAYLCDKIGRKYTLMFGFCGYLIFGLIIGCAYDQLKNITALFIVFYGLMNCLANAGPGDMLGVTSSESFPTAVRGTLYGLSAAIGKVGAVAGTESFQPIRDRLGPRFTFIIAAACGVVGILFTYFCIPHSKELDLMELDIKFHNYLVQNGWEGTMGFDESEDTETGSISADSTVMEVVDVADKKDDTVTTVQLR